jgi:hypothetical protein
MRHNFMHPSTNKSWEQETWRQPRVFQNLKFKS